MLEPVHRIRASSTKSMRKLRQNKRSLSAVVGAGAGAVSVVANASAATAGVAGASGALCGIMASMAVWIVLNRRFLSADWASTWLRRLGFFLVLTVLITFGLPNISAGAHFGGGGVGLVTALALEYLRFGRGWQRAASLAALVAVPVGCVGLLAVSFWERKQVYEAEQILWPQLRDAEEEAVTVTPGRSSSAVRAARRFARRSPWLEPRPR